MELLAKLEEEEGGQDLTREQLRSVILVLGVVLIDAMVVGPGGSVLVSIDTVLALTNSPSRHRSAAQPLEPSSAAPTSQPQPAMR